jgi:hypothetical protein
MWPKLDAAVLKARRAPAIQERRRSTDDMLSELVDGLRRIERRIDFIETHVVPDEFLEARQKEREPQDLMAALEASVDAMYARREAGETGPLSGPLGE